MLHTRLVTKDEQSFLDEARIIAHLKHPHIVQVLEFGVSNGFPFLVMDYAPNGTLRQCYPQGVQLLPSTIVPYVNQIADALQYIHDMKLIHRDVKPENMLLGWNNQILLSDFGIALMAQSSQFQSPENVAGTIAYMAPEQLRGKPRPASDQYAFGVVVYEWLTGDRLFHGSFSEIASQHLLVPPKPLREKVPTISPAVEQVILTALEKDPHKRFASVQAFAAALQEASVTTKNRLSRRTIIVGLTGVVMTGLVGGSITWLQHSQKPTVLSHSSSHADTHPSTVTPPSLITTLYTYSGHSDIVYKVAWSHDSKRIASASGDGTIQIWNALTGSGAIICHSGQSIVSDVAWSPDDKRIVSASDGVQLWSTNTGNKIFNANLSFIGHQNPEYPEVFAVAWSPDGKNIATGGEDGWVNIVAVDDGESSGYGNTVQIRTIAWSANGQYIAFGGHNMAVKVMKQVLSTVLTYIGHLLDIWSVAWSPDGKHIASGGSDHTVQVWDASTGHNILTYHGHSDVVLTVAWSPDGKHIASGGVDQKVQVWDASTGKNVITYRGHNDIVNTVAWSPDGKHIASGGVDRKVRVWKI